MRAFLILVLLAAGTDGAIPAQMGDPADGTLSPAWEIPFPDTSAPFLVGTGDGFVVGTPAGRLIAHGADGSGPLWETDLGAGILSAPVFGSDHLAILLEGGAAVILRSADGILVSRLEPSTGAPTERASFLTSVPDGFVLSEGPAVTFLDPSTGEARWKTDLPAPPSTPAAECGSHLLIGTTRGTLISLDPADGRVRWNRPLAKGALTTPAGCWRNRAFVGAADNRLYAVKLKRKRLGHLWSFLTGGDISGRPVIHGDRIHFLSYDTYLYALEADNGHLAWRVRLGRRPRPDGVLDGDRLVVAPLNTESLEIFELPGGTQGPSRSLPDGTERFVSPPIRAGKVIVIAVARYGEDASRLIGLDPGGGDGPPSVP